MRFASSLLAAMLPLAPVSAQSLGAGSTELPPILPEAREIALTRSAAPAAVSNDAAVLILRRAAAGTRSRWKAPTASPAS